MINHTDQLVVPVTAMEDRAEAARLTLQTLESRGGHDAELARNAVVIVSESTDAGRGLGGHGAQGAPVTRPPGSPRASPRWCAPWSGCPTTRRWCAD